VPSSDPELIAAILGGSESAFAELMGRYQDRIFRLLSRYTRDALECEDLAQEVFLKVFRKLQAEVALTTDSAAAWKEAITDARR
jgi:DNA-directed RNA polymerase specialized sigma24 family protein